MRNGIILALTLAVGVSLTSGAQSFFSGRLTAGKQNTTEPVYPTAVDNSLQLLASADSVAQANPLNFDLMFLPVVFDTYRLDLKPMTISKDAEEGGVDAPWLSDLAWRHNFYNTQIQRLAEESPWLVPYNIRSMPEPPKQYEAKLDAKKNILTIHERKVEVPAAVAEQPGMKMKNWIHTFDASLQFSQAYMSDNWYQGGNNNLNLLGNFIYNLQLNQTLHPKLLFTLKLQYKVGVNSAPDDKVRDYNINEDLFQANMKFGLKATSKFYYSMNMQFKTQLLQNFEANSWDLDASFLTPGELNAGIGMTYNTKNKKGNLKFSASLSPLSYNMKTWRANYKLLDSKGEMVHPDKLDHQVGSSGECNLAWALTRNIALTSRLFAFTDYSYLQGDWETTLDFSINKFLSTRIYAHLRFDDSLASDDKWKHWQFKEIFSFGLQYKFN